jgi:hypothetical protein
MPRAAAMRGMGRKNQMPEMGSEMLRLAMPRRMARGMQREARIREARPTAEVVVVVWMGLGIFVGGSERRACPPAKRDG